MTRSTGKRAEQERRQGLFVGESRLLRVQQHLLDKISMARHYQAWADVSIYATTFRLVRGALKKVLAEQEELG